MSGSELTQISTSVASLATHQPNNTLSAHRTFLFLTGPFPSTVSIACLHPVASTLHLIMAFVTGLPLSLHGSTTTLSSSVSGTPLTTPAVRLASTRMGYGDYSYLTDKTKGHVQQYYVDKFRIAADFVKGTPASDADGKLGRDAKGAMLVPTEGIPQEFDAALPARDENVVPDPRIAEAKGAVFPWDMNYVDPQFLPSAYSDVDDENVAGEAFAAFRGSLSAERGAALTAMDFGAQARVKRIMAGLDETYLLCLDGALDANYARLQKIADPATFTPTGQPQTEIPGTAFLGSIGALDFQEKPGENLAFWKDGQSGGAPELPYKRPSGSETPELPYNTSATVDEMKEAQSARGLLAAEE